MFNVKGKLLICVLMAAFIFISAFRNNADNSQEIITRNYTQRCVQFKNSLSVFRSVVKEVTGKRMDQKKLRIAYSELRASFKSLEYLLTFSDPDFVNDYINGAPLPRLEENSFGPNIKSPEGLQVIDGLMAEPLNDSSASEVISHCDKLISAMEVYVPKRIHSWMVFAAARSSIIRISTMGISGFDLPGTDNAITDAISALSAIKEDFLIYKNELEQKQAGASGHLFDLLDQSVLFLRKNNDFDQLDRFGFQKDYLDPLYGEIFLMHKLSGYEMPGEVIAFKQAVNYNAVSLFAPDFLDPLYYLDMPSRLVNSKSRELGRLLFFEPLLSGNHQRSCASCHDPLKGFADARSKSESFDHTGTVKRNSPTVFNAVFSDRYFHDLRARDLGDQMEHVITSAKEFNTDWDRISETLNQSAEYRQLFAAAFNTDAHSAVNSQNVRFAMAAYISGLYGFNSQFDQMIRGELTEKNKNYNSIVRGYNLFAGKAACASCHFAPVFNGTVPPFYTESESEVLGVPEDPYADEPVLGSDKGRGEALLKDQLGFYAYSFKTPGLRNIALTAPYMHNGSYPDLQKVMEFYNSGGGAGIGIKLPHQTLSADALNLKKSEIRDIIAFLNALTDTGGQTSRPERLPVFENNPDWNTRKVGGIY